MGEGAYVTIVVKYGLIKILTLKEDLCDQMKNVDKECPLKKGDTTITKDVELPSRIPPVSLFQFAMFVFVLLCADDAVAREPTPFRQMCIPWTIRRSPASRHLSSSDR